jgi:hypothetical protein
MYGGHKKDINEYYTVSFSITEKIKEMKSEGKSTEDIEAKVSRENRLNSKIVAYIISKEVSA